MATASAGLREVSTGGTDERRRLLFSAMSRLFHYTSVNGLRGIIDSGNIRATHLGFLNDLSEGQALRSDSEYRARLEETDRRSPVFVASFCRHAEPYQMRNGLLSQWRGYAGEGGGYCVVFDETVLDELVDAERRISPGLLIVKKDIVYADTAVPPPSLPEGPAFFDLMAFTKNEAFAEENETRIMLALPPRASGRSASAMRRSCSSPSSRSSAAAASCP